MFSFNENADNKIGNVLPIGAFCSFVLPTHTRTTKCSVIWKEHRNHHIEIYCINTCLYRLEFFLLIVYSNLL